MNADKCVICGKYVPEGRQVCYECEWSAVSRKRPMTREEIKEVLIRHRDAFANDHGWAVSVLEALDTAIGAFAKPKEMTARKFANEFRRMRDAYLNCMEDGDDCPLYTANICSLSEMENIVPIVEQWAKEHPEKKRKTYEEDLLDKYPRTRLRDGKGFPLVCRWAIYGKCKCHRDGCVACWNEEMEDEE